MTDSCSQCGRFQADFVVDRISGPLLAPQVSLRCLNAHMTEQELNLFKLPASLVTQAGACAPQIVRGYIPQATFRTTRFHHAPYHLRTEAALTNPLGLRLRLFLAIPAVCTFARTGGRAPVRPHDWRLGSGRSSGGRPGTSWLLQMPAGRAVSDLRLLSSDCFHLDSCDGP